MPGSSPADTQNSETSWKKRTNKYIGQKEGNFSQGFIGNFFNVIILQEYVLYL